jgi:D-alanyl-D-alanine carboxypeptidase
MSFAKNNRSLHRCHSLFFSILCCASLFFASTGKSHAQVGGALDHALQEIIDEAREEFNTVGLAVGLHIQGHGIWTGSSGLNDRANETPLRPDHLLYIGSITKTFAATTVLLLAEDGVLGLDDSVEQWLPGLVPNGENITIRQLLNHTSGLYDYTNENSLWESTQTEPDKVWGREEIVALGTAHDPNFDPGTRWSYSSTGYTVLGMIVEKATGMPFIEQMRSRLLDPQELHNTFLPFDEEVRGEIAHGYYSSGGQLSDTKSASYTSLETSAWTAGAMVSTVGDLVHFVDALFGGRILNAESQEQMLNFVPSPGYGIGYGLGVLRGETAMGISLGHNGAITGFNSYMDYLPDQQVTIVVLVNHETSTAGIRDFVLRRLMPMGELFSAEHIQVFGDDVANGWSIVGAGGAEPAELTASGPVYEGDMAASIQVAKPARFSARWKVEFTPEMPLLPLGYTSIRLAIHPGDMESAATSNFSIALNGGQSTENLLRGSKEGLIFDAKRKEWQIIEVPIEFFQLFGPIEHIDVQGNMGGTFYIDDVQLVAAPHPPATAVLEDHSSVLPQALSLHQNYPNPFNSGTVIRFALPQNEVVQLAVYNMAGQQVAKLVDGTRAAGAYAIHWDGRDDAGRDLASGMYLYRLQVGDQLQGAARKLLLLR